MTTHTEQFSARPFHGAWAFFNRETPICSGRTREEAEKMASDANLAWAETAKRERLHDAAPALLAACEVAYELLFRHALTMKTEHGSDLAKICAAIAAAKAP